MAKIDFIEKGYFEELFNMGSGYVLDFTNREFQEFTHGTLGIDIYLKYPDMSKAKILRAIITEYDDKSVGKFLLEILRYMQAKNLVKSSDVDNFKKCAEIGNRLIGKITTVKPVNSRTANVETKPLRSVFPYDIFKKELQKLANYEDTPQNRGFEFEKYLKKLLVASGLEPRGSFKITGEQIDGSFVLHNEIYLLEARWRNKLCDKSDLVIFNEKVSSKSGFTRGVYISFSGFSNEAISTFANGRTVNIVLLTVQELAIALERELNISELIWQKVRALGEEGDYNKSIF